MIKRLFDILLSGLFLIAGIPLFVIISVSVRRFLGSPVFFSQARPGLNSRPFQMYKFRSMTNARDTNGKLLPNEQRVTRFGNFLRASSLDELPELWNVLKGDMSLVGPRPLLMDYLPHYTEEQQRRHTVRPGITGWAQVNGRNAISWDEKLALDVWYVDNRSLGLDLWILVLTVIKVVRREGISQKGHFSMPRFDEYMRDRSVQLSRVRDEENS